MQKILLINDSKFESFVMKDMLDVLGYETITGDEETALKLVKNHNPNFVIANYIMKKIAGDQLIAIIKASNPGVVCILSSNNPISREQFTPKKIDAVFQTPIDKAGLRNIFNGFKTAYESVSDDIEVVRPNKDVKNESKALEKDESEKSCTFCGHDLDISSGKSYAFCPWCGHKLRRLGAV